MGKEIRETIRKECEVNGNVALLNRTRHCKTWIEILDKYLEVWEKRLGGLGPGDQAVSGLQTRLGLAIWVRNRLVEIRDEVESDPPPAQYFQGRV